MYKKPIQLQSQYKLSSGGTERQLLHTKQCFVLFFRDGEKAGKLLAYQAWAEVASRLIPRIKLDSGDITSDPTTIKNTSSDYYSRMYSSETYLLDWEGPNPFDLLTQRFLQITVSEVKEALKSSLWGSRDVVNVRGVFSPTSRHHWIQFCFFSPVCDPD